jgi:hypothetical protein
MKKYPFFCKHKTIGFSWFRIFGYGLVIKDITIHPMIFSERMKKRRYLLIGKYLIKHITPGHIALEHYN